MSTLNMSYAQALSLTCPEGGKPYICEGQWIEFVGCCESDPCSSGNGCPKKDLRAMSCDARFHGSGLCDVSQQCESEGVFWEISTKNRSSFTGCCANTSSGDTCSQNDLRPAVLIYDSLRLRVDTRNVTAPLLPTFAGLRVQQMYQTDWKVLHTGEILGFVVGFAVLLATTLGFIWKEHSTAWYRTRSSHSHAEWDKNKSPTKSYWPVPIPNSTNIAFKPQRLESKNWFSYIEISWELLLTVAPIFFIAIGAMGLCLDQQKYSSSGDKVLEITRLIPTIYPIVFAAVAGRFYKNIARWRLEKPHGVSIGNLEHIFGSQSLAGSFERLLFVRARVPVAITILILWSFSPLGGQAGGRILSHAESSAHQSGNVYYSHPSFQTTQYRTKTAIAALQANVNILYSASLISSPAQKRFPRDAWDLPRIPQWKGEGEDKSQEYDIEEGADYVSLLGINIKGLTIDNQSTRYEFSVETSYLSFNCKSKGMRFVSHKPPPSASEWPKALDIEVSSTTSFSFNVTSNEALFSWSKKRLPPSILYTSYNDESGMADKPPYYIQFECSIEPVVVETDIACSPSSSTTDCSARRQRLVDSRESKDQLLDNILGSPHVLNATLQNWVIADGLGSQTRASPVDRYISGSSFAYVGYRWVNWTRMDMEGTLDEKAVSRRLTTSFNTFWWATLDPIGHTNVSLSATPRSDQVPLGIDYNMHYLNSTDAKATITTKVYQANRAWITVLLITSFVLELFAVLGFTLSYFIRGPDILGFASSLTRENPYVPVAAGGTGFDGAERARLLKDVRIKLVDVQPGDEIGYIVVKEIPEVAYHQTGEENSLSEEPLTQGEMSTQYLSTKTSLQSLSERRLYI